MAELTVPATLDEFVAEATTEVRKRAPKSKLPLMIQADPAAIANFDSLPRPKAPPGRTR